VGALVTFLLAAMLAADTAKASSESGWPGFRGPRGDGTSSATNVPLNWSESNNVAWKVPLPGRGHSTPIVLLDRLWLTTALEQGVRHTSMYGEDMLKAEHVTLEAISLDRANGNILWRTALFEVDAPAPIHSFNSWATPTPVIEPGRLYCDFGNFGTACLDAATGKVLWKTRLPVDDQFGPGSSPVLWRNLLIFVRDGRDAQYVAALDKQTGQIVWKVDRPPMTAEGGYLKKSFITPLLINNAGQTQLVAPAAQWVVSYDPVSGKELWRARHGEGYSMGSSPVFGDGLAVFSTGFEKPQLVAVRVDGQGDVTATHIAWKTLRQAPAVSSPVLAGNELYWVSDAGVAACGDVRTGEIHWQERVGGLHLASLLFAEGRVYFFAQNGKTTVVKAGRQYEKLAENQIEGRLVATPAILDGTIFLRTETAFYRIGKK